MRTHMPMRLSLGIMMVLKVMIVMMVMELKDLSPNAAVLPLS
jgi:hypothetical protein